DAQHLLRELLDCGGFESSRGPHRGRLVGATPGTLHGLGRAPGLRKKVFYRPRGLPLPPPPPPRPPAAPPPPPPPLPPAPSAPRPVLEARHGAADPLSLVRNPRRAGDRPGTQRRAGIEPVDRRRGFALRVRGCGAARS